MVFFSLILICTTISYLVKILLLQICHLVNVTQVSMSIMEQNVQVLLLLKTTILVSLVLLTLQN